MKINDLVPWRASKGRRLPVVREQEHPFLALQREMDRVFDRFFDQDDWFSGWQSGLDNFSPPCNLTERDEAYEVTFELPGLDEEDVDITLSRDSITVKGEKREEKEEKEGTFYRRERRHGAFSRTIALPPDAVDLDKVEAIFKNGVLSVTLPRSPEAQEISKRIPVRAG